MGDAADDLFDIALRQGQEINEGYPEEDCPGCTSYKYLLDNNRQLREILAVFLREWPPVMSPEGQIAYVNGSRLLEREVE